MENMTIDEVRRLMKPDEHNKANQFFDKTVAEYFRTNHTISDTVDFFLQLGSLFTKAGHICLARASIGAAKTYKEGCS